MVRFTYLAPPAREFFADWDRMAKECAAALGAQAAQEPFDRELSGDRGRPGHVSPQPLG